MSQYIKIFLVLTIVFAFSKAAFGQHSYRGMMDSTLTIESNSRLDTLVSRHIRVNKAKDGFDGYRIQIYSGSGNDARQEANDIRAEFIARFPLIPSYLIYQAPNFKVRVGDFRTEVEATQTQRDLAFAFPQGFVARDLIKFPKLAIEGEKEESSGQIGGP